jgi:hypothetical protein
VFRSVRYLKFSEYKAMKLSSIFHVHSPNTTLTDYIYELQIKEMV